MTLLEILKTLNRLLEVTTKLMSLFKSREVHSWLDEVEAVIDQLEKAKTQDEKTNAARKMVSLIRDLH